MRRILFSWHGLNIYSYPAMLYAGLLAGVFVGAHAAQASGMNADRFAAAIVILLISALAGSRLYFVLTRWDIYRHDPARIWRRTEGGMACMAAYPRRAAVDPTAALVGSAIRRFLGRRGADDPAGDGLYPDRLLSQRVFSGRPSEAWFALFLPDHHGVVRRRIPTQLMEMAFAMLLFGVALGLRHHAPFPGAIFCSVVAAYGVGRWYLEGLRDDETGGRDKTAMQATSLLMVIAALAGLAYVWDQPSLVDIDRQRRRRMTRPGICAKYTGPICRRVGHVRPVSSIRPKRFKRQDFALLSAPGKKYDALNNYE